MNDKSKIRRYNEVFELIQRVHTAFGDMFPYVGLVQIGGSRKFVRKPFISQLEYVIANIRSLLALCDSTEYNENVSKLWLEITKLLSRLELNSKRMDDNEINSIAKTLYFASGIAWNYLLEKSQVTPVPDKRYLRVESVDILLKITNRIDVGGNADLDKMINMIINEVALLANCKGG